MEREPDDLERAKERRDWVLARIAAGGLISTAAAQIAEAEPLKQNARGQF